VVKIRETIQLLPIDTLKPYERNAKKHPKEQVERLALHIEAVGWDQPIVVDENMVVLKGHGRLLVAKKLKMTEVPCVVAEGLSEAQKKAVRLADNKLAESEWDLDLLKLETDDLALAGWDLEELGFDAEDKKTEKGSADDPYTSKIVSPIYTPKGPKPKVNELFDLSKHRELMEQIEKSQLPDDEKNFLRFAAHRHVVFNYQNCAEYYAQSSAEMQCLMENSALVIIDFNKAIELGFVKLTKELAEAYDNDVSE